MEQEKHQQPEAPACIGPGYATKATQSHSVGQVERKVIAENLHDDIGPLLYHPQIAGEESEQ